MTPCPDCGMRDLCVHRPYGGIARQDRIEAEPGGPWCDKAWHLGNPVRSTVTLRCSMCAKVYARCAQCNRGRDSAASSMRAHLYLGHRQGTDARRRKP